MAKITKRATIKDVCNETGLALGTVSKYLNGGQLKEKNRILIENAINKLNYSVDLNARAMITKRTYTVGVVLPSFSNSFYGVLTSEIGKCLTKDNYEMIVKESNSNIKKEIENVKWFIDRRVDAIVCFSSVRSINQAKFYQDLNFNNIIFVDNMIEGLDADYVITNNKEITIKALNHLAQCNHKTIAGLFPTNSFTSQERHEGFIEFKEKNIKNGIVADSFFFDGSVESAYEAVGEVINSHKYSALFTSNYISTLGAVYYFNEKNIKVPNDISMIGFDNIMLTNLFKPKLTIVNQPLKEIAKEIVKKVIDFDKVDHKKTIVELSSTIIMGDTVKKDIE